MRAADASMQDVLDLDELPDCWVFQLAATAQHVGAVSPHIHSNLPVKLKQDGDLRKLNAVALKAFAKEEDLFDMSKIPPLTEEEVALAYQVQLLTLEGRQPRNGVSTHVQHASEPRRAQPCDSPSAACGLWVVNAG